MRQLEYFVTAAASGSYSSAAKKLFVSPQAISKGVQVLERSIGVGLFERGPNGIALTSFGETFYEEAKSVLESLERLQNMAARYQQEHAASLTVGIHSLCFRENGGTIDWNDLLGFHDAHKDAAPIFLEMRGDSIFDAVVGGEADFGITVPKDSYSSEVESVLLKRFPLAAVVSSSDEDFASKDAVTIKDLAASYLVLFSEEDAFNSFFIEQAREDGIALGISPLQIRAVSDIDFVIGHSQYTVRPYQHATRTTRSDRVRILPIIGADHGENAMPLTIFWKKDRKLTELESLFVEMVVNLYRAAESPQPEVG
ncbi:LysR family transcriptional regulator [Raoultibacter phocaeensis]|uniref:LysR family transcriptional regulator n=1 Tax=Raoultibacter phocaeensis TaxID=2479841 RepID=UPI002101D641|nr:LysR family transcriptional regulator [Raoultibacter phocaeensis]